MAERLDDIFFTLDYQKGTKADRIIREFLGQIRQTRDSVEKLAANTQRLERTQKKASATTDSLTRGFKRLLLAVGGLAIIRRLVRDMSSFETRIAEIATIAGGGAEQVEALRTATLALTRDVPQSADELGAGAYQILSAGISDTADVLTVLEASSKAAVAGLTDTETAVDAVTTVLNAFSLEASEATRVTDILFKTVELGKLKFTDLAQNLGNAATSAALAGVSIEELTSGIAVLTQRGIKVAEATSSLNRLFLTLTQQSKEQAAAFEKLGIEFNVATVAEKGFAGLLAEVNKLTAGQIDSLSELFPNIRAARAAFVLAGDALDDYQLTLDKTIDSQGSAQVAFEIMNATATNQGKILRNNVIATFQEIGVSILPGVAKAFGFLAKGVRNFVGGVKLLGVDAAIVLEQIKLLGDRTALAIGATAQEVLDTLARFAQNVGAFLARAAIVPGPQQGAIRSFATVLQSVNAATIVNTERLRDNVEVQERQLELLREVAAEERIRIVQESEFVRQRQANTALAEALAEAESTRLKESMLTAEEREKLAKRRAKLEAELAEQVAEITKTAAERQIASVQELRDAFVKEFGEISAEVEAQFAIIEQAARDALAIEQAEEIAKGFRDAIKRGLEAIEVSVVDLDVDLRESAVVQRQLIFLKDIRDEIEARLESTELTVDAEEKLRKVLVQVLQLLGRVEKTQQSVADAVKDEGKERLKNLITTLSLIRQSVDGALDLATAFGLVNEETAETIRNFEQIAIGAATLATSIATGNAAGIVSGGLGLIGGIASAAGESPQQRRLRETQERNTEALAELSQQIGNLDANISGTQFASAQEFANVIQAALGFPSPGSAAARARVQLGIGGPGGTGDVSVEEQQAAIRRVIADLGFTVSDFEALLRSLGVTFSASEDDLNAFAVALEALAAIEITQFTDTVEGQLQALQARFDIFDISNPIAQLEALAAVFTSPQFGAPALRKALAGLDLSTPEGRRAADEAIRALFERLESGQLLPSEIGALSGQEFLDALRQIEGLIDRAGVAAGDTQDVRRAVQITELQAGQLLAFQSTLVFRAEERNAILHNIAAILSGNPLPAPAVAPGLGVTAPAPVVPSPSGALTLNFGDIIVGGGSTTEQAEELVAEISTLLGQELDNTRQLLGIRT